MGRQSNRVRSALASLDELARVWFQPEPPPDLEERQGSYDRSLSFFLL
jgi:hypothetical protein